MGLQLVSVNIEGRRHLDLVTAFLQRERAEVVCLMEVHERDVALLSAELYPYTVYAPNVVMGQDDSRGVAILSQLPIISSSAYYCGEYSPSDLPRHGKGTHAPVVLFGEIEVVGERWQIGAIHFSWTAEGSIDLRQRRHVKKLLHYLARQGGFVLAGDCNIPRGNEMYHQLAREYHDNIPSAVITTLDPRLHYANKDDPGKLQLVVDYVWSTPAYTVKNVHVVTGVSDHCGLVCSIDRV